MFLHTRKPCSNLANRPSSYITLDFCPRFLRVIFKADIPCCLEGKVHQGERSRKCTRHPAPTTRNCRPRSRSSTSSRSRPLRRSTCSRRMGMSFILLRRRVRLVLPYAFALSHEIPRLANLSTARTLHACDYFFEVSQANQTHCVL